MLANGSLQAFAFLTEVLMREGTTRVLVEAPTYDRSLLLLARYGAEAEGIPVDEDGLDVDALERALGRGGTPAFLYVIPNFQNPSGATLSLERRQRLVELAAEREFLLVEDDPYGLLRWAGESLPSLLELGGHEHVVSLSSFTKTVAPGLRAGYAIAPDGLAKRLIKHAVDTQISPSSLSHATLAAYCAAGHFEPHLVRARAGLQERCTAMAEALAEHFPSSARYVVPDGGYFLWVELEPQIQTGPLLEQATAAGVPFVKGADFYAHEGGESSLRLAFSAVQPDEIREGIARLGGVVSQALADRLTPGSNVLAVALEVVEAARRRLVQRARRRRLGLQRCTLACPPRQARDADPAMPPSTSEIRITQISDVAAEKKMKSTSARSLFLTMNATM